MPGTQQKNAFDRQSWRSFIGDFKYKKVSILPTSVEALAAHDF
jgi:hypothetical protein